MAPPVTEESDFGKCASRQTLERVAMGTFTHDEQLAALAERRARPDEIVDALRRSQCPDEEHDGEVPES
jgi:hypothetical protein